MRRALFASAMIVTPAAAQYAGGGVRSACSPTCPALFGSRRRWLGGSREDGHEDFVAHQRQAGGTGLADHQNKADIASATARKWYDTQDVDAIFDINGSVAALAVREVSGEKGKVDINSGAAAMALTNKHARRPACTGPMTSIRWRRHRQRVVSEGFKTWYFITADYTSATI